MTNACHRSSIAAAIAAVSLLAAAGVAQASTTYRYTGQPYDRFNALNTSPLLPPNPFTAEMAVTGSITFAAPLAPNTNYTSMGGDPSDPEIGLDLQALEFSFSNGAISIDQAHARDFGQDFATFLASYILLSTDENGDISDWSIFLSTGDPNVASGGRNDILTCSRTSCPNNSHPFRDYGVSEGRNGFPFYKAGATTGTGSWSVVPVPLPAAALCMLSAIGAVSATVRRRAGRETSVPQ